LPRTASALPPYHPHRRRRPGRQRSSRPLVSPCRLICTTRRLTTPSAPSCSASVMGRLSSSPRVMISSPGSYFCPWSATRPPHHAISEEAASPSNTRDPSRRTLDGTTAGFAASFVPATGPQRNRTRSDPGWGLHPLEKRRLVTAHVETGPWSMLAPMARQRRVEM
jgi:hypothetical protein